MVSVDDNKTKLKMRCDIEYYLPQIVAAFLRPDLKEREAKVIGDFLINCSKQNFFFAHKFWFTLSACKVVGDETSEARL
jgi:hypothetical protein